MHWGRVVISYASSGLIIKVRVSTLQYAELTLVASNQAALTPVPNNVDAPAIHRIGAWRKQTVVCNLHSPLATGL